LGKLSVVSHLCSFDLSVSELMLPQLAPFDRLKVALIS